MKQQLSIPVAKGYYKTTHTPKVVEMAHISPVDRTGGLVASERLFFFANYNIADGATRQGGLNFALMTRNITAR